MDITWASKYIPQCKAVATFGVYDNGNHAVQIFDKATGEPLLKASVNPYIEVGKDELAVKNWSENEGAEEALLKAGIITGDPISFVRSGHVMIPIYKLGALALQAIADQKKKDAD